MSRYNTICDLFEEEPIQWGLRGDPYLWREMRKHFTSNPIPSTFQELEQKIEEAFLQLTGHPLSTPEFFSVEKYAFCCLFFGGISPEFWHKKAIQLLKERYNKT